VVDKDKSEWIGDVLGEIRKCVKARKYRITRHAQERQEQYNITLPQLLYVLSTTFQTWKYAIRGKAIDSLVELRIIVAFKDELAILTVIRLGKKGEKK